MQTPSEARPAVLGELGEPDATADDPRELLLGYLDWYRDRLLRKLTGLPEQWLREPVAPLGWSPLGLVQHLGWVERRWLEWGFAAADVRAYPPGDDSTEWTIAADMPTTTVVSAYVEQVGRSRSLTARAALDDRAAVGGRFPSPEEAPSLGRILVHLLQEYARHLGQLDVARELVDGTTGE